ncbi:MAG: 23S rRNA (uracil(1939)-C(5))-methyltransferase RlmD [Erysipelotrichaceae bacterium]|nr:23S rRNA (uracil(1939)-C(5))-methyltransferase RlmD [Erysipelotrichaceae bacterium]
MKKNDHVIGTCIDYTYDGMGIVKIDGFCLFVKNMLVGEQGEIVVTKLNREYGYGRLLKRTVTSNERVEPKCKMYPQCGGCQLQHFSVVHQAEFKKKMVQQAISHIGKLDIQVEEVLSMEDPWKYRNKMQLPVQVNPDGSSLIGFYRTHSHQIMPLISCEIQSDLANQIVSSIREWMDEFVMGSQVRHLLLKTQEKTNEVMVVFVTYQKKVDHLMDVVNHLLTKYPMVQSVIQNINSKETNVVLGNEEYVLYGRNYVVDHLGDFEFHISSRSFYQVNPSQTKVLYDTAVRLANIDETCKVADVYCGVGTITMFLSQHAKEVVGIEIVPQAIADAKENAKRNGITNVRFMCGDAKHCTKQLVEEKYQIDVAVIDPPRKGSDQDTLDALIWMNPKRIVYVSCNPSTLARDLRYLEDHGYETKVVQPVDMFPQTYHVETVCLMSRKEE